MELEAAELGDAQARRVEELEDGSVTEARCGAVVGGIEEFIDVALGKGMREGAAHPWTHDIAGKIIVAALLTDEKFCELAEGSALASERGRLEVLESQLAQVERHLFGLEVAPGMHVLASEEASGMAEIGRVGLDGVGRTVGFELGVDKKGLEVVEEGFGRLVGGEIGHADKVGV